MSFVYFGTFHVQEGQFTCKANFIFLAFFFLITYVIFLFPGVSGRLQMITA
jgi:hypothetical protein